MKKKEFEEISKSILICNKCILWKTRNKPVIGDGSINSNILLIGEAPGKQEDKKGLPFVGRAGKLLNDVLESINLNRQDIYITNVIKCRPPNNRIPSKKEINKCKFYLDKQINILKPKLIITLGNCSSKFIFYKYDLKHDKITNIHGKKYEIKSNSGDFIIIPIFHPAAVIYNPNIKNIFYNDFKKIKKLIK